MVYYYNYYNNNYCDNNNNYYYYITTTDLAPSVRTGEMNWLNWMTSLLYQPIQHIMSTFIHAVKPNF